jgi:hypothetical protein
MIKIESEAGCVGNDVERKKIQLSTEEWIICPLIKNEGSMSFRLLTFCLQSSYLQACYL